MTQAPRRGAERELETAELARRADLAARPSVKRAVTLAKTLDSYMVDPIVGFFLPGAGDLLTAGAGLYLVAVAFELKLPAVVIARMLLNLALDMLVGAVPVLGDLFDVVHKANARNAELLQARHDGKPRASDWLIVSGAFVVFLATLAVPIALLWLAISGLRRLGSP